MAFLRTENLSKVFRDDQGEVQAFDSVNVEVRQHEFVAFLGPSGCGKTTLLRTVAGLVQPTEGRVVYREGEKFDRGDLGFVFQDYALFDWKTAGQNLMIAQELAGQDPSKEQKQKFLEMVELEDFEDSYPGNLSGGMRQRLALARTLIYNPDLVLMDEPFAALDELTKERLYSGFKDILEETDKTVMYVTHDIEEAYMFADRIVVMAANGKVVDNIDVRGEAPRDKESVSTQNFRDTKERIMDEIGVEPSER